MNGARRHFGSSRNVDTYDRHMGHDHVVQLGKLLSDHTRIALLDALFDGLTHDGPEPNK